jgi:glycosyltransferase involved in cell wall biosynthesis
VAPLFHTKTSRQGIRVDLESANPRLRVVIVQEHLPHYRAPFYEKLRSLLSLENIDCDLLYDPNTAPNLIQGRCEWAHPVPIKWIGSLGWQPVFGLIRGADLIVVQQEMKYLLNFVLLLWRFLGGPKVAFWGHGRNMQTQNRNSYAERVKRCVSTRVDWWFAYNALSATVVRNLGFPRRRITHVNNAIDTAALIRARVALLPATIHATRAVLGIKSTNVAIYTGGLYEEKRIPFLLKAAAKVRKQLIDFHLIVIGGGPHKNLVVEAARNNVWIHFLGPKNDAEKLPYWALSKVSLIPGAVGLGILDSFALGVPLITSRTFGHGPEIAYLKPGINGVMVEEANDSDAYAAAVVGLLRNEKQRYSMIQAGLRECAMLNIEAMAQNFAEGIKAALSVDKLKRVPR